MIHFHWANPFPAAVLLAVMPKDVNLVIHWHMDIIKHIVIRHILSCDIHEKTTIGENLCIWHCFGIAINPATVIGNNVTIGHNTTLGENRGKSPVIEDNVSISPGCSIIGGVRIGTYSTISIGSVVIKDVEPYTVVAGNPAKIIRKNCK